MLFLFTLQLLTRLLKSNLPEDLRAANELIQTLVKEVRRRGFQWALQSWPWACICACAHAGGGGHTVDREKGWSPGPEPGNSHGSLRAASGDQEQAVPLPHVAQELLSRGSAFHHIIFCPSDGSYVNRAQVWGCFWWHRGVGPQLHCHPQQLWALSTFLSH